MARVTVEDCLEHVENRFELVSLAAKRAHHLAIPPGKAKVEKENDKPTVLALREIAAGVITREELLQVDDSGISLELQAEIMREKQREEQRTEGTKPQ